MNAWRPPKLISQPLVAVLNEQQASVLAGLCLGHSNEQIARRMLIAVDTVKTYLKQLYPCLGAYNRAHAVALACSGQVTVVVEAA
jgi:DNA-binding NarL/FixJ family response regulator